MRTTSMLLGLIALAGCAAPPPADRAPTPHPSVAPPTAPADVSREVATPASPVDELAQPLIAQGIERGLVIEIVHPDATEFHAYGARADVGSPAPTPDTAFEIASLSKLFTATVLADMVVRGEVTLDRTVEGTSITFAQLATHTSGLPRIPPEWPVDMNDPYAGYSRAQLQHLLTSSAWVPGRYQYSNLGFGVLGDALARAAGVPLSALIETRIARPLGLARTRVGDVPGDVAAGHTDRGDPAPAWTPGILSGAYAVRSTARDLAAFVRANLAPAATPLGRALALTHVPRVALDGRHVALAWHIKDASGVLWHGGRSAGFTSFVACSPARGLGIVVLANTSTDATDQLGAALVRRYVLAPPPAG